MGTDTTQIPGRQQLRIQETQKRLLDAAEDVFVRDGYEAAQLDEIAARADRSKGAVYTHFESKEDLFLALFEHRAKSMVEGLMASLRKCKSADESMAALRKFYVERAKDRTWPILTLEFKLFALRHPESKERLRKAIEMVKPPRSEAGDATILEGLSRNQKADINLAIAALGPVVVGLILESYFEPEILNEKGLRKVLARIFDALLPASR